MRLVDICLRLRVALPDAERRCAVASRCAATKTGGCQVLSITTDLACAAIKAQTDEALKSCDCTQALRANKEQHRKQQQCQQHTAWQRGSCSCPSCSGEAFPTLSCFDDRSTATTSRSVSLVLLWMTHVTVLCHVWSSKHGAGTSDSPVAASCRAWIAWHLSPAREAAQDGDQKAAESSASLMAPCRPTKRPAPQSKASMS